MPGSVKALLFDIDGTLADTDALHLQAFNRVFGPRGHVFDRARAVRELMGFSNASIGERFLPHESPERRLAIMEEKEAAFRSLVAGKITPMPGLMPLLAPIAPACRWWRSPTRRVSMPKCCSPDSGYRTASRRS
jgi:beta-phosphoglucomutase-like phosphatase (HAD superfamily)